VKANSGLVRYATGIAVLAIASTALMGCASNGSQSTAGANCGKTFTFPLVGDQTGPIALVGQNNADAAQLKINEINAAGGVDGYCLAFNKLDTGNQPTQAAEIMRSLASTALVAIGPFSSTDAKAALPVAVSLKIPVVTPGVSDKTVMDNNRPWTFDTFIVSATSLPLGADKFIAATNAKRVIAITNQQDDASKSQAAIILAEFANKGATLVKRIDITTNQLNYTAETAEVRSLQADAILVAANPNAAGVIVKTLRSGGVSLPIDVSQNAFNPDFLKVAGETADNAYTFTQYYSGLDTPRAVQFHEGFLKVSNGIEPGVTAPAAYDAVGLMADALARSGVLKSNKSLADRRSMLRDALASTTAYQGVLGDFDMGETGVRTGGGVFLKMTKGQLQAVTS
jgi:branched-chain amino acid transport system substrate-binding protein